MEDLFQSERLLYRAVEPDEDEDIFVSIQGDAIGFQLSKFKLSVPQSKKNARSFMMQVAEESLLGVVICLKSNAEGVKPEPIGVLHLSRLGPNTAHHRHTDIGIDIIDRYQGLGYGGEAIKWATSWAFEGAALHRVQLRCFEYNSRASHLYQKLGFKEEGRWREFIWHKGRFWDDIQYSILAREWRALKDYVKEQS